MSKGRILLVISDLRIYNSVSLQFEKVGYETVIARNVTEGLKLAHQENFELFLIDWLFEDGSGIELCRAIRQIDTQTPILFYTDENSMAELATAIQAGAQGCYMKPADGENS